MIDLNILHEDNHIIVVEKPYNILSQADSTGDIDMLSIIKDYIKNKYNKPGNVYLGLVHRLDRPTRGIMVFAKTSKAASRLSKSIKEHTFNKDYMAVVHGKLIHESGEFEDYLEKDSDFNSRITDSKTGKLAQLKYEVKEYNSKNNLSLVKIELITGRHHQIRVQFASRNHPLVGDKRYGNDNYKKLMLVAYKLEFIHPVNKEKMSFKINCEELLELF